LQNNFLLKIQADLVILTGIFIPKIWNVSRSKCELELLEQNEKPPEQQYSTPQWDKLKCSNVHYFLQGLYEIVILNILSACGHSGGPQG